MQRTRLSLSVILGTLSWLMITPSAIAKELTKESPTVCPVCAAANDQSAPYATKAGSTLARGASNAFLGWTELIKQPAREAKSNGNVLMGIAKGAGQGVQRTIGGVAEILTFWTPKMGGRYFHTAENCPVCAGKTK